MTTTNIENPPQRLESLDTLRGFDMLWIIGGGMLIRTISEHTESAWVDTLAKQVHHASWRQFYCNRSRPCLE